MDINTIKQRVNNLDPNSLMASVVSLIGTATTTDMIAFGYFIIATANFWHTFTTSRGRATLEKESLIIANKQKEEELRAARLNNDSKECSLYCTPETCKHKSYGTQ